MSGHRAAQSRPFHAGAHPARAPRARTGRPWIEAGADGALVIHVRARPGASRSAVRGADAWRGALQVDVAAPAEDGRANDELIRCLAAQLRVPRAAVVILRGARSRDKDLSVTGLQLDSARDRLEGAP